MKNIFLSVRRPPKKKAHTDKLFRASDKKVLSRLLERDDGRCRACGFVVLPLGGAHPEEAPRLDQIRCFCPFCLAVQQLEEKRGVLLYLPGVNQILLNHLVRSIFFVLHTGSTEQKKEGFVILKKILELGIPVKESLGTVRPTELGRVLLGVNNEAYSKRRATLDDIKLCLFPESIGADVIDEWAEGPYKQMGTGVWHLYFALNFGHE